MNIERVKGLSKLKKGSKVWCGGDSGFCYNSIVTVKKIIYRYDTITGEKYKVICFDGDHQFDSRTGWAITPPLAYYLQTL